MRITTMWAALVLALAAPAQSKAEHISGARKPEAQNAQAQNSLAQNVQAQNNPGKPAPVKGGAPATLIPSLKGRDLFHAYCASCHGTDAKGGGPMAASLKVAPADLTRISARNSGAFPKMRIERIISGEEQPASGHGSSAMPVWGPIFSQVSTSPQVAGDVDLGRVRIDNLALYLMSIQQTK